MKFHLHNKNLLAVVLLFCGQLCFAPAHAQTEVGDNDFRISFTGDLNHDARNPAIAYIPTEDEYLVFWSNPLLNNRPLILATSIDATTGATSGSSILISNSFTSGRQARKPALAYNSVKDEILVVWEEDARGDLVEGEFEIFGQILSSTFNPIGGNFRISDMGNTDGDAAFDASEPAVAFNSVENEYLVVWYGDDDGVGLVDFEREIFGQRLNENGLAQGTNDFRISDMGGTGNSSFSAFVPAVAFNSVQNEYLVVWRGDDNVGELVEGEDEIFGQRLSGNGTELGNNDFRISDMGDNGTNLFEADHPAVAFNSVENEYLVVWEGEDNVGGLVDEEFEIFGQRLNENGLAQGTNDFRISDMGDNEDTFFDAADPAVTFNSVKNEYLVVWRGDDNVGELVDGELEIFGQRLNENGKDQGDNDFRISDVGDNGDSTLDAFNPAVAFSPTRNEALVVWQADDDAGGLSDGDFEIYGQRLEMTLFADGFESGNTSAWSVSVP